ncbi:hypothetical protein F9B85_00945 [Heliorestis acidaminivorans]|uniref:Uncharacterized protein n=1 Tax=Heliorestis acidaminivorans TaxID=553427 RepID=A0A6I0F5N1_9FIRM|nr:hypothetical protein [Heliorestis acidaminivorans]KAB2954292.1 hypothetical protein F9B85_00945 [Heliorestis acidaminivorans]
MAEVIIAISILAIVAWIFLKPGYQHHSQELFEKNALEGIEIRRYKLKRTRGEDIFKRQL